MACRGKFRRLVHLASVLGVIAVAIRTITNGKSSRLVRNPVPLQASSLRVTPLSNTNTSRLLLYYITDLPELTEWLVGNHTDVADRFYSSTLNENSGEVWLHRGFAERLGGHRTLNAKEADVILIPSYLHLLKSLRGLIAQHRIEARLASYPEPDGIAQLVASRVAAIGQRAKPHVLLVPTTNPSTSLSIGIAKVVAALQKRGVNLYSVGYERNTFWQRLPPSRILPIPYVVRPDPSAFKVSAGPAATLPPQPSAAAWGTILFYAGNARPKAVEWSGCNRSMILPLVDTSSSHFNSSRIDVRLTDPQTSRLAPGEYNRRMANSRYCLVLCGDTPTSRSLTSSLVHGCTPLIVGSRLRGRCEPPCHPGWGWTVLVNATSSTADATKPGGALTHLPFEHQMNWSAFPELDEAAFADDPVGVLDTFLAHQSAALDETNREMLRFQNAFVYGVGSPVRKDAQWGGAVEAIWIELQQFLFPNRRKVS
jgi:Exostosin family